MTKKIVIFLFSILSVFLYSGINASKVGAVFDIPQFPSCPNPGGTLIVSYPDGTHGIPGDSNTYTGSDSVYSINSTQNVQCFCASNGSGIQSNWWKAGSISQKDIDTLRNLGWIFIPDGSLWGLDPVAYMVKNENYNCNGGGNGGNGGSGGGSGSAFVCTSEKPKSPTLISVNKSGSQATLTWTPVENATHYMIFYGTKNGQWDYSVTNTGKVTSFTIGSLDPQKTYYYEVRAVNNCQPSDSPIGGGDVLGASTFAPTGTVRTLLLTTLVSIVFFGLYVVAKIKTQREA